MSVLNSGKFSTIRTLNTPFFPLFLGFPLGICYNSFIASQFWIFFLALPIFNSLFFLFAFQMWKFLLTYLQTHWLFFLSLLKQTQPQKQSTFLLRLRSSLLFSSDSEAVYFLLRLRSSLLLASDSEAVYFLLRLRSSLLLSPSGQFLLQDEKNSLPWQL